MASLFRFYIGGVGTFTGISWIVCSGLLRSSGYDFAGCQPTDSPFLIYIFRLSCASGYAAVHHAGRPGDSESAKNHPAGSATSFPPATVLL
ncbi:MAG: hypothetical protein R2864_06075 [Syntrophotaleaceae bacterium]